LPRTGRCASFPAAEDDLVAGRAAAFLQGPYLDRQRGERPRPPPETLEIPGANLIFDALSG
jgi:hypothetical protein